MRAGSVNDPDYGISYDVPLRAECAFLTRITGRVCVRVVPPPSVGACVRVRVRVRACAARAARRADGHRYRGPHWRCLREHVPTPSHKWTRTTDHAEMISYRVTISMICWESSGWYLPPVIKTSFQGSGNLELTSQSRWAGHSLLGNGVLTQIWMTS